MKFYLFNRELVQQVTETEVQTTAGTYQINDLPKAEKRLLIAYKEIFIDKKPGILAVKN